MFAALIKITHIIGKIFFRPARAVVARISVEARVKRCDRGDAALARKIQSAMPKIIRRRHMHDGGVEGFKAPSHRPR